MTLPLFYNLQNSPYGKLLATDYSIGVLDMDEAALNADQMAALHAQGKTNFTYISIGEAENYRDYWIDGGWSQNRPDFVLGRDPGWAGNFYVKFWDADWQAIMFDRVAEAVAQGWDGMYLDIIDAYERAAVVAAYDKPGGDIRQDMIDFVIALSAYAKSLNPDFKVIPQNAVGLLAADEADPTVANAAYLAAIDGIGAEDLWYDEKGATDFTPYDVEYIQLAANAGKFVLATSYPTKEAYQQAFVEAAAAAGFIPFVADRELTGKIDATNLGIAALIAGEDVNFPGLGLSPEAGENHPVVAHDDAITVMQGGTVAFDPFANDYDHDGEAIQLASLSMSGPGALSIDVEGNWSYRADDSFVGTTRFTYGVADAAGATSQATVDIVVTRAPATQTLSGTAGDDVLTGGLPRDTLIGKGGNDQLHGGANADVLKGGGGNDRLEGGAGVDTLYGGSGADRLVWAADALDGSVDVVKGFRSEQSDAIDLAALLSARVAGAALTGYVNLAEAGSTTTLAVDLDGTGQFTTLARFDSVKFLVTSGGVADEANLAALVEAGTLIV